MRQVAAVESGDSVEVVIVRTLGGPKDLAPSCCRAKGVPEVGRRCRLLIVPLFRGSSRLDSLILSHHVRF